MELDPLHFSVMAKLKLVGALVLAILAVVIVLQNTASVETKILFQTVTMPRAVLLLIATMIGFALGVLVSLMVMQKSKKAAK